MTTSKGARARAKRFGHSPPWETTLTEKDVALARRYAPDLIAAGYQVGDTLRTEAIHCIYEAAEKAEQAAARKIAEQDARQQKVAAQKRKAAPRYKKSSTAQWREWLEPVAERFPSLTVDELASTLAQVEDDYAESLERRKGNTAGMVLDAAMAFRFLLLHSREERLKLERRIETLEATGGFNLADAWQGTFVNGREYRRGQVVTYAGSLWLAVADTTGQPSKSDGWKLVVKRGTDAK